MFFLSFLHTLFLQPPHCVRTHQESKAAGFPLSTPHRNTLGASALLTLTAPPSPDPTLARNCPFLSRPPLQFIQQVSSPSSTPWTAQPPRRFPRSYLSLARRAAIPLAAPAGPQILRWHSKPRVSQPSALPSPCPNIKAAQPVPSPLYSSVFPQSRSPPNLRSIVSVHPGPEERPARARPTPNRLDLLLRVRRPPRPLHPFRARRPTPCSRRRAPCGKGAGPGAFPANTLRCKPARPLTQGSRRCRCQPPPRASPPRPRL